MLLVVGLWGIALATASDTALVYDMQSVTMPWEFFRRVEFWNPNENVPLNHFNAQVDVDETNVALVLDKAVPENSATHPSAKQYRVSMENLNGGARFSAYLRSLRSFEITHFAARADFPVLKGDGMHYYRATLLTYSAWHRRENDVAIKRTGAIILLLLVLAAVVYGSLKVESTIA